MTDSLNYQEIRASVEATVVQRIYAQKPDAVSIYNTMVAYPIGIIVAILFLGLFLKATMKPAKA